VYGIVINNFVETSSQVRLYSRMNIDRRSSVTQTEWVSLIDAKEREGNKKKADGKVRTGHLVIKTNHI
jgi:hypothetical protein